MQVLPVPSPILARGDDLAAAIRDVVQPGDIVVVSSKVVARTEGADVALASITPSSEAMKLSQEANQDPRFTEFILRETKRMNGSVLGTSPSVILTSLKPTGMIGRILCPNAGADLSNIEQDRVIGWPLDPVVSVKKLSASLGCPVIMSDSCCTLARSGVTAFALVCCGLEPLKSEIGSKDLFGKTMRLTQEAVADQLAVAANAVMGNSAQSTPAAIIRDFAVTLSDFGGWVPGIEPSEDLYRDILRT